MPRIPSPLKRRSTACLLLCSIAWSVVLYSGFTLAADPESKLEPKYPFRVGWANEHLPWYQLKNGEFPPHHSDKRIGGELVQADFIHRTGQFRMNKTGELVTFTMPPYGAINHLNAEADLRDVPLGTFFLFFLNQDANGNFTKLATMQDQFTMDAGHSFSYRLDEVKLGENKLLVTKQSLSKNQPDLGRQELRVNDQTRVWKGDKQVKLSELAAGDELLYNRTADTATTPSHCIDIWVGAETHKGTTEKQRQKFAGFVKFRGLPGWIDRTEGNKLTVSLFSGDAPAFQKAFMDELKVDSDMKVVVANDELRTWNVPVDNEKSKLLEIKKTPVDAYGTSGVQLTFTVNNMLEGFRKGRIVRIFAAGWPNKDQFYGESLMGYGFAGMRCEELKELLPKEYPTQFPFRTDYGNEKLPWYQLVPGKSPPRFSEHLVFGELVKVDDSGRAGQFRTDRTGETVDFTLTDEKANVPINTNKVGDQGPAYFKDTPSSVRYLNAEAPLSDIPLGTRCRFHLYQDTKGAFTRATLVSDEFSYLATNVITYRIDAVKLDEGKIHVARQIPEVKDYNGDMQQPPDIARAEFLVNEKTRVWKGEQQVKLSDLSVKDVILLNVTGEAAGKPSHCTDIWVGADTHKRVSEQQASKQKAAAKP